MGEVAHATDERGGDQGLQNRAGPRCSNPQSGKTSLGKRKVIQRRIEMFTTLADAYRTQYWELADELLSLKYTGSGKSEGSQDEAGLSIQESVDAIKNAMGTTSKESLPHAIRLQESVKDLDLGDRKVPKRPRQENIADKGIDMISRVEMSSYNALCREMDNHGALAMLCGMKYTYYIRSTVVSIGRRAGPGKQTRGTKTVDVDLVEEAASYGHQDAISRCQARIFLDGDGCFRVYNCGKRGVSVDGSQIEPGKSAVLQHLSLISVAGVSLLFLHRGVDEGHSME
ncbi:hypothetical protein M9434_003358 [Picochlorum sp. BPE23]|nr:hypothetical protein M9434_003358 [Picochlorum sp. BPE23]